MKHNTLTVTALVDIYTRMTHGSTPEQTSKVTGVDVPTVRVAYKRLRQYIAIIAKDKQPKKRMRKTYVTAAKLAIEQDHISMKPSPGAVLEVPDIGKIAVPIGTIGDKEISERYTEFNEAVKTFQKAVFKFIDAESAEQMKEVRAENAQLRALLEDAKVGNWAGALKQHFEGDNNA